MRQALTLYFRMMWTLRKAATCVGKGVVFCNLLSYQKPGGKDHKTRYLDRLQWKEHHQMCKMLVHSRMKQSDKNMWPFQKWFFKSTLSMKRGWCPHLHLIMQLKNKQTRASQQPRSLHGAVSGCQTALYYLELVLTLCVWFVTPMVSSSAVQCDSASARPQLWVPLPTTFFFEKLQDWGCRTNSSIVALCLVVLGASGHHGPGDLFYFVNLLYDNMQSQVWDAGHLLWVLWENRLLESLRSPKYKSYQFPLPLDGSFSSCPVAGGSHVPPFTCSACCHVTLSQWKDLLGIKFWGQLYVTHVKISKTEFKQ